MRRLELLLVLCAACGSTSSDGPRPGGEGPVPVAADSTAQTAAVVPGATAAPATRWRVSRNLIAEAGRAELRAGGLFIDIGTLDQHKFSRGGWMSGWGRNTLDGDATIARIDGRRATLDVVLDSPTSEIVLRARGRSLGVSIGKGAAKKTTLSKSYQVHRIVLAKPLPAGRHQIQLQGRGAEVDWLWMAETTEQEAPVAARQVDDALQIDRAGHYDFYLIPKAGDHLEAHEATGTEFRVTVTRDGGAPVEIAAGNTEKPVALADFVGSPVRVRISSKAAARWTTLALTRAAPVAQAPATVPKNVIVLLIDTQRADSFSVVGEDLDERTRADAYESLVPKSSTFRNAYNNENWTKPSIATIDTALYPDSHGARWRKDRCSKDLLFLSEHLKAQGFETRAMVSNISAGPKFGFNQGWDKFEKTDNAAHAFGRATAWLQGREKAKPFFLYIQTIDPHVPFSVPEGAAEKLFGGSYTGKLGPTFEQSEEDALSEGKLKLGANDARWLKALYDAEVLYHDKHLGLFLKALEAEGTLADTAFIVLNDHGEERGEHGRWGHGWTVGDVLYRSPLLMHFPGLFPEKTFEDVVEHIDIAPTIVDALGLPEMPAVQGQSLMPLLRDEERAASEPYSALLYGRPKQRAIRVGDFKMLLQANRSQTLYNMKAEPAQKTDVKHANPIALRLCEVVLGEAMANPRKADRLRDRSDLPNIRAEYIDE